MTEVALLLDTSRWPAVAKDLEPWVATQRWFGGKARTIEGFEITDVALLGEVVALVLVEIRYADGGVDRYQVPLAAGAPRVVEVDGASLTDATDVPAAVRALVEACLSETRVRSAHGGMVRGSPVEGGDDVDLGNSRKLGVEQSNTSVVIDDALILKVFRRLEAGEQPDVELTRALTEAGFANVPAQAGALHVVEAMDATYLMVVSAFLSGAQEGWELAVREARAVLEGSAAPTLAAPMHDLGRVVARMHEVLRDALGAEEASPDDADGWSRDMEQQAKRVLDVAAARDPEGTAAVVDARADLLARFGGLAELGDLGLLVRTHGDLHLGQVLLDEERRWQILDFEGEPARPLAERRVRQTPLRDVAGVLRSFDYAAASAALEPPPHLAAWRDAMRAAFLDGYRTAAGPAGLVPDAAWPALLAAFELDKAVYELGYELANRPTWVAIPVAGILRVLGAAPTPSDQS